MKSPRKLSLFFSKCIQYRPDDFPLGVEAATTFFYLLFTGSLGRDTVLWHVLGNNELIQKLFGPHWIYLERYSFEHRQINGAFLGADRVEGKMAIMTTPEGQMPHVVLTIRFERTGKLQTLECYRFFFEAYSGVGVAELYPMLVSSR